MRPTLLFANGDPLDGAMVRRAIAACADPCIVAADGGALVAEFYGYTPQIIIGDMDSLDEAHLARYAALGAQIQRHPAEKDETDLELALMWCAEHACDPILIVGALGGRLDQLLANIYLLAHPALSGHDVQIVAGDQRARLLTPGTHSIDGAPGDTLSLLPVGGTVENIHTDGLYYPLTGEALTFGPARGVSNVLTEGRAQVRFGGGLLLAIHTIGRA